MDRQGRLSISLISADTRISIREVVSIGVDSRVEIWSKADWKAIMRALSWTVS